MTGSGERDAVLSLDDEALMRACRFEAYKSGGPGGQKRNKTSSGARLTHVGLGVAAHSNDFRSQATNRVRAVHRLRLRIAATVRVAVEYRTYEPPKWLSRWKVDGRLVVGVRNPEFCHVAAHVLDVLSAVDGNLARAGALLGVTTSSVTKLLGREPEILNSAAAIRRGAGLPPISN